MFVMRKLSLLRKQKGVEIKIQKLRKGLQVHIGLRIWYYFVVGEFGLRGIKRTKSKSSAVNFTKRKPRRLC